jgi:hypothetical protein
MPTQIPSGAERAAAREANRTAYNDIVREARCLAVDFGYTALDRDDPTTKGLYKLYGSGQAKDGGPVEQIALRSMVMADLPGFVALVREYAVPFAKMPVTGDFGGAWVFEVPAKSKNPHVAEIYDGYGDKVAVSFTAVAAILANKNQISVPSTTRPGQRDFVQARDPSGNPLPRLGLSGGAAAPVASAAPAGQAMRSLLKGVGAPAAAAPTLTEAGVEIPF